MKLRTAVILFLSCVTPLWGVPVTAQKASSAAKGDSPVREIVRGEPGVTKDPPEKYRGAIEQLALDYQTLLERFEEIRSGAHSQTFRNVIIAHLVARTVKPSESDAKAFRIVELMKNGKSLDDSLRLALSLTSPELRRLKHAAERQLQAAAGF